MNLDLSWLAKKPAAVPDRAGLYLFHGVEGSGKTGLAARFPKPAVMMTPREQGLLTLIASGQAPNVPHSTFPAMDDGTPAWAESLDLLEGIRTADHDRKTLVVDVVNHLADACQEYVLATRWGGDRKKFAAFGGGQGAESMQDEWRRLLFLLDAIRRERGMAVVLCCHSQSLKTVDPQAGEYYRAVPLMHPTTWGPLNQACDVVGFINFEAVVQGDGPKKVGVDTGRRMLHLKRSAAWDAKNRLGLPDTVDLGDSADAAWENFLAAKKAAGQGAAA